MSHRREIRLLGAFRAMVDGATVDLTSPRAQSLLAYLIIHANIPQSRQHLAFVLWPDSTERQARTNLRKVIHQIRNTLPSADDCLITTRTTVQWRTDAPYHVDVLELAELLTRVDGEPDDASVLRHIADLYEGDLLPGNYDDWIGGLREGYHRRVRTALGTLVQQLEESRDYDEAIRYAHRRLDLDRLDETAFEQLMRLYLLNGNRSAALNAYGQFAEALDRELGSKPGTDIQLAYLRALDMETAAQPWVQAPPDGAVADQLVGREEEWRSLRTAWQRALLGNAHVVAITGEAGIGKTRLAEELLAWARRQGYRGECVRFYAAHGALAYAPVTDLLRTESLSTQIEGLDDIWLSEIARLQPELLNERPELPAPQPMAESWQRQRFFDALARAIPVDDAPLLLQFDDLQWSDQETLEWLAYLLHRNARARLMVIGTVRTDEVDDDHPYRKLELALTHSDQLTEIALSPLDHAETQMLAVKVAGRELPPEQSETLYADTEGNPLFVVETVRAQATETAGENLPAHAAPGPDEVIARLPTKVHTVIRGRLARLSPRAHELANLAAVAGRSFSFDVLRLASEQDTATLADGIEELLQSRIIVERGADFYDFSHDRIRDVAYVEISRVRRRLLHDRVAQTLLRVYDADLDSISGQLAEHFLQAGRKQEAIDYFVRAGDRSAGQYANEEALKELESALALLPENELEQRYAILARRLDIYERRQDVVHRLDELDALEDVINRLDDGDSETLRRRANLLAHRSLYAYQVGLTLESIQFGEQAMKLAAEAQDPDVDYLARLAIGYAYWAAGDMQKVRDLFREPLARAKHQGRLDIAAEIMSRLAATGMFSGMPVKEIKSYIEQSLTIHEQTGDLVGQADGHNKLGYLHVHAIEGAYGEALAHYVRSIELGEMTGSNFWHSIAESNLGYVYILLGDYATARTHQENALRRSRETDNKQREGTILVYLGVEQRNRGDNAAALLSQEAAQEILSRIRLPLWGTWSRRELALIHRAVGNYEAAEQNAREAIDMARRFSDTRQEGYALTVLGLVLEDQRCPDASEYFMEAIDCYQRMELHNRSMAPLAGLARLAASAGNCEQAHATLEQILDHLTAHELDKTEEGFRVYVTCYRLLQAAGDPRAMEYLIIAQEHLRIRASSLTETEHLRMFWDMANHREIRDTALPLR